MAKGWSSPGTPGGLGMAVSLAACALVAARAASSATCVAPEVDAPLEVARSEALRLQGAYPALDKLEGSGPVVGLVDKLASC